MKMSRGKTFKPKGNPAKRPGKVSGRVANDVFEPGPRSAVMPPPTTDTREPRGRAMSRGGGGKGLTKGGQGGRIS
jgi:hypothetical protein